MDRPAPTPNHPPYRVMPRAYKPLPPAAELWEMFDYKPLTGELVRRKTGRLINGATDAKGYKRALVNGRLTYNHRIIWAWVTGAWPAEVDHIDRNKSNNSWGNLRCVTRSQNMHNVPKPWIESRTTKKGVRYRVRASIKNQRVTVGTYDSWEEANLAGLQFKDLLVG